MTGYSPPSDMQADQVQLATSSLADAADELDCCIELEVWVRNLEAFGQHLHVAIAL